MIRFALAAALLVPAIASAQLIRGRLFDAVSHQPLLGALVELRDLSGKSLQLVLTSPSGAYQISAPGAGRYLLRAAAIGYTPHAPSPITVPADGLAVPDILLAAAAPRLPDLVALSKGKYCGKSGIPDATFGRLLESAHTALQVIEATINSHQLSFQVLMVHSKIYYGAFTNFEVADSSLDALSRWPVEAIDIDTLREFGFMRMVKRDSTTVREYYGPDPKVLFSDWFLDSHCFTLDKPKKGVTELHVRFAPAKKSKLTDIGGELVLDPTNLALLEFQFTHRNLPSWIPDQGAWGEMQFVHLDSGLWITTNWALWGPIEQLGPTPSSRSRVGGITEVRGTVLRAVPMVAKDSGGKR